MCYVKEEKVHAFVVIVTGQCERAARDGNPDIIPGLQTLNLKLPFS